MYSVFLCFIKYFFEPTVTFGAGQQE